MQCFHSHKTELERFDRLVIFCQQIHKIQSTVMLVFLWSWSIINVSVLSLSLSISHSLSPSCLFHSLSLFCDGNKACFTMTSLTLCVDILQIEVENVPEVCCVYLWKERPVTLSIKCCSLPLFFQFVFPLSLSLSPSFFPSSKFNFDLTVNQHRFRCYQNPEKIFSTWIMIHTLKERERKQRSRSIMPLPNFISHHNIFLYSFSSKEEEEREEDDGMMKNKKTESHFHKIDSVFLPSWNLKLSTFYHYWAIAV